MLVTSIAFVALFIGFAMTDSFEYRPEIEQYYADELYGGDAPEVQKSLVPYRDRLRYWAYHIALAHRGEMVYSPTRDAQYEDGRLKRGYDKSCARIDRRLERAPAPPPPVDVPSFERAELGEQELDLLMGMNVPFVIRGGADELPLMDWTLEYLEGVAGECEGPVNEAPERPSEDLDLPTKSHHYYDFRRGTLSEVVASIRSGGNLRFTTAEDVMHHDDGRLRKDLDIPHWERVSGWERHQHHWLRSRLFVGKVFSAQLIVQPGHAYTLWHAEPGSSFFVLAKGVKTWTLAHPHYTAAMQPRVKKTTNYSGSNIDCRETDDVQRRRGFRGYVNVPKCRVTMRAATFCASPTTGGTRSSRTTATTPSPRRSARSRVRTSSAPDTCSCALFDEQYHAIVKAFDENGRITDEEIGQPRKSRSVTGQTA